MVHGFLTFCCVSRSDVMFAKTVSTFAENVSVFFRRPWRQLRHSHIIYCFISLKPASTVFPPNCHSNLLVWSHQKFVGISQYVHFSQSDQLEATSWKRPVEVTSWKWPVKSDQSKAISQKWPVKSDQSKATIQKQQVISDQLKATSWKRPTESDQLNATSQTRDL
jgi:hypothetical protein